MIVSIWRFICRLVFVLVMIVATIPLFLAYHPNVVLSAFTLAINVMRELIVEEHTS